MKSKNEKKTTQSAPVAASGSESAHISIILDRTGSMDSIKEDTIGGFNTFLKDQQAQPGRATLTLVQFDSQDPYEVIHNRLPLALIPPLNDRTYVPRATTPLLDAMGRGINDLDSQLGKLPEKERPGKIVVVIITDGQENASVEFTKKQVEKMIKAKEAAGWQFVFLSADLASIGEASKYGFAANRVMAFDKDGRGAKHVFNSLSQNISEFRRNPNREMAFTDKDRQRQRAEAQRKPPAK